MSWKRLHALWCVVGVSASAQSPACDTAAMRASAVPIERLVAFALTPAIDGRKLPRPFVDSLVERLGKEIHLPRTIATSLFSTGVRLPSDTVGRPSLTWAHGDVHVIVRVVIAADGKPRSVRTLKRTGDPAFDGAVDDAFARVMADASWMVAPGLSAGDSAVFNFTTFVAAPLERQERSAVERRERAGTLRTGVAGTVTLAHYPRATVPRLQTRGEMQYPESQRQSLRGGSTLLNGVLDNTGRFVQSSVWFDNTTHPAFEHAAGMWILGAVYRPATIGGCAVSIFARMPFTFQAIPDRPRNSYPDGG